jgi:hypothetical protein
MDRLPKLRRWLQNAILYNDGQHFPAMRVSKRHDNPLRASGRERQNGVALPDAIHFARDDRIEAAPGRSASWT